MTSFNRVLLMGDLARDPDLRYTSQGAPVATFSLAVNRKGGNGKDEADYFDIEAWDKTAESCNEYLCKGSLVMVEGRLKQERWGRMTGAISEAELRSWP